MPELILHHYATSPFAEKVRLVLGHKRLAWRSVVVPMVLPKPDVVALTGGYRRTPFLQIGADVYCDTELVCRVLDALQPEPPLYPHGTHGLAAIVAQWADSALFWTVVPYVMRAGSGPRIMTRAEPEHDDGRPIAERIKDFAADRARMMGGVRPPGASDLKAALLAYLDRLDALLADGRPFLLGPLLSIADFSAVHPVWFLRLEPPASELLAAYPRLLAWLARIEGAGHGSATPMSAAEALRAAAAATAHAPASVDESQGFAPGEEVTVTPIDYAQDAVAGRLVGIGPDETVIERSDPRAGTLHVHFPRIGYHVARPRPAA